jgi:hypothetical protein
MQAAERVLYEVRRAVSGSSTCESSVSYDLDSQSWKIVEDSSREDLTLSSEDFPISGMIVSGCLYALPTLARLNDAKEVGFWPTPTFSDRKLSRRHGYMLKGHSGTTLTDAVVSHHGGATRTPGKRTPTTVAPNPEFSEVLMGFSKGWTLVG